MRRWKKTGLVAAAAAAVATVAAPAAAQENDRPARAWAAACAGCHGPDGRSAGAIPVIAGADADTLWRTLLAFKNGQRPATVMHQHTKGYTDDELLRIARVFAAQAR